MNAFYDVIVVTLVTLAECTERESDVCVCE